MLSENQILAGRYRIRRSLGSGGQGTVYLSEDIKTGGFFAIKERRLLEGGKGAEELIGEAGVLARLRHPGLPRLRQVFRDKNAVYMILEYVEGRTLKELLSEKGRLPEKEVLPIIKQLAEILRFLHRHGIRFLDLKPSNIMLTKSQEVRLIDFGAAEEQTSRSYKLTRGYAAPEQYVRGAPLDERTDLYALGVTFHFLLTGKNPNQPPFIFEEVRKLNPKITKQTERLVLRLLQPAPEDRFSSAEELLGTLPDSGGEKGKKKKWIMLGGAAAAVLMVGVLGAGGEKESSIEFSLDGGTYRSYQLLTLNYDEGLGRLYFTTDGSEPTKESSLYQDGIVLSRPEVTVRAKLLGFDGSSSQREETYHIDVPTEYIETKPSSALMWDVYFVLGKHWNEPLYTYELAEIRELPEEDITEEDRWIIGYMPFLRRNS